MPPSEDEEEDYMSMVIEEPKQKETFTQKKLRQQREVGRHTPYTPLPIKPTATKLYIYIYIYILLGRSTRKSPLQSRTSRTRSCAP